MVKPATAIQFRLPFTTLPSPGTNTSSCSSRLRTSSGQAARVQVRAETREATTIRGTPTAANIACRQNTVKAEPPLAIDSTLELDSTITRPKQISATDEPSTR